MLANAVGQLPLQAPTDGVRGQARSYSLMIVPTLRVGMHPLTLCVRTTTQSVASGVTTRSVGTIIGGTGSMGTIIGVTRNRVTHSGAHDV